MGLWRRLGQFYPVWLELFLLGLIAFSLWYPVVHYPEMPLRIPTHFGASGLPDAWSNKNLGALLLLPLLSAVAYANLTFLSCWMALVDDPKKTINAPKQQLARMSAERAELIRRLSLVFLFVVKAVLVGMLAYLSYGQTRVALGEWRGLGWLMWVFFAALMGVSAAFTWQLLRLVYRPEK